MNTATRLLREHRVSAINLPIAISKVSYSVITMAAALLITALSMIYVTNNTRSLHATLQQGLLERDRLHVEWGQLLLEKGTWIMQSRVEQVAGNQLGMMVPDDKSVVIVDE